MINLKDSFLNYANHFQIVDYLAFTWLAILFFLLLFLAIFIAKGRPLLAMVVVFLNILFLFIAPFGIKHFLDLRIRSNEVNLTTVKQLYYSDTLILRGVLANSSNIDFKQCKIKVSIYPKQKYEFLNILKRLKPHHFCEINIEYPPKKGEYVDFEYIWDNFRLNDTHEIYTIGECY